MDWLYSEDSIAKRCPNGKWLDPETNKCIPKDEWEAKYGKKEKNPNPKQYAPRCDKRTHIRLKSDLPGLGKKGECISRKDYSEWYKKGGKEYLDNERKRKSEERSQQMKERWERKKKEESESKTDTKTEDWKEKYKTPEDTVPFEPTGKAEGVAYSQGFIRDVMKQSSPDYYKKTMDQKDAVVKNIKEMDWEDGTMTTKEAVEKIFAPLKNGFSPLDGSTDSNFVIEDGINNIPKESMRAVLEKFVPVIEAYPWGLPLFWKMAVDTSAIMSCSHDGTINFNPEKFSGWEMGTEDWDAPRDHKDPITGEWVKDWYFSFKGATRPTAIMHEWGHMVDNTVFNVMYYNRANPDQPLYSPNVPQKHINSLVKSLTEGLEKNNVGDNVKVDEDGIKVIGEKIIIPYDYDDGNVNIRGWDKYLSYCRRKSGVWRYANRKGPTARDDGKPGFQLSFELNKSSPDAFERAPLKKDVDVIGGVHGGYESTKARIFDRNTYMMQRNNEVEALYKKLFNVDQIIPSECYSTYGYYGTPSYDYGEDHSKTYGTECAERMAEAVRDVAIRGENANSMSQLLAVYNDYMIYCCTTGDWDTTYEQYVEKHIGFDKFTKKRIIKVLKPISASPNNYIPTIYYGYSKSGNMTMEQPEWMKYAVFDYTDPSYPVLKGLKKNTPKKIVKKFKEDQEMYRKAYDEGIDL